MVHYSLLKQTSLEKKQESAFNDGGRVIQSKKYKNICTFASTTQWLILFLQITRPANASWSLPKQKTVITLLQVENGSLHGWKLSFTNVIVHLTSKKISLQHHVESPTCDRFFLSPFLLETRCPQKKGSKMLSISLKTRDFEGKLKHHLSSR